MLQNFITALSILTESEEIKMSAIEQFIQELPQKALYLGVRVLLVLLFFIIGLQIIKGIRRVVRKALEKNHAESGVTHFLDSVLKAALSILLFFMIASSLGLDATSVAAVVGSAGVAISLAVQGSLSNFAGGVLIMLLKPFKVGDYIKEDSKGNEGTVTVIDIFYTKLQTPDNKVVVLPNGTLANSSLTNVTACDVRRLDFKVGISYETDLRVAKSVLQKVLEDDKAVLKDKEHTVYVDELGTGVISVGVRCWFMMDDFWEGKWRILEEVKYALDRVKIQIPNPQMDVHMQGGKGENANM